MAEFRIRNKQLLISSSFDINDQRLINVGYPVNDTDAVTKSYVDLLKSISSEPTGFLPPTETNLYDNTISVSGDTFSIQPTGTTFRYYIEGTEYASTGDTITISDIEGQHFIYYDGNILKQTTTFSDDILYKYAYVAELYWDSTNKIIIHIGNERHGMVMDWATHVYLHSTFGTQYVSGLGISLKNPSDSGGNTNADAQIETENGKIRDEDITHVIINNDPQILSPISYIPVYYRTGNGLWRKDTSTSYPVKSFVGGNNLLAWNEYDGSIWTQTEVDNNDYVNCHIFATNDIYEPIISVQGQSTYQSISNARIGANNEIGNLVTNGLSFQEFTPIATIIYQTSTNYNNVVKARIRSTVDGSDYIDWRFQELSPTTSPTSHSSLTNLNSDDHLQYLRTDGTRDVTGIMSYSTGFTFTSDNNLITKSYIDTTVNTTAINYATQTGLYRGGTITIVDGSTFNINSGIGYFVDPISKIISKVEWNNINNISVMSFGTTDVTISIGIDSNGDVFQQIPQFTSEQRRNYIILGELFIHPTDRTLVDFAYNPIFSWDIPSIVDIHLSDNNKIVEGNTISNNGNNLLLDATEGKMVGYSNNAKQSLSNPNISEQISITGITFFPAYFDGLEWVYINDTNQINPNVWSNGTSTLQTASNKVFNLKVLFRSNGIGDVFFMAYPTQPQEYDTIEEAQSGLMYLDIPQPKELFSITVPVAWLIVREGITDLSNPEHFKIVPIKSVSTTTGSIATDAINVYYDPTTTNNITSTNVQDALDEVNDKIENLDYNYSNKNMSALSGTSGIYLATNTSIIDIPYSTVRVMINSMEVNVGNGSTLSDCFFSDDGGSTAKSWSEISQGDNLYWNGDIASYQLESDDIIDFIYLTR